MGWSNKIDKPGKRSIEVAHNFWSEKASNLVPDEIVDSLESLLEVNEIGTFPGSEQARVYSLDTAAAGRLEIFNLRRKATYFLRDAISQHTQGYTSSAEVSAYHSCLFSMRALLGLVGIFFVPVGPDSSVLVDCVPHHSGPEGGKKFRKNNNNIANPILVYSVGNKWPSQKDFVDAFSRFYSYNMYTPRRLPQRINANISKLPQKFFSGGRNQMIYGTSYVFELNRMSRCSSIDFLDSIIEAISAAVSDPKTEKINAVSGAIILNWIFSRESFGLSSYEEIDKLSFEELSEYEALEAHIFYSSHQELDRLASPT